MKMGVANKNQFILTSSEESGYICHIVYYRNPTPLIPPQLIHAAHGGWLEQDKGVFDDRKS